MAAGNEMRVSDAERDAAAGELREHFASGRLNQDELDQRLTAIFTAKTRGDVDALFTDLPGHAAAGASAPGGGPFWPTGAGGPFGPSGPFGSRGRFGADGPFGPSGQFGPGGPFGAGPWGRPGVTDGGNGDGDRGGAWRAGGGPALGRTLSWFILSTVTLCGLLTIGILGAFGIWGGGRPLGFVLLFAAFGLLRRLLFIIFGRRRAGRGGGRRGRGGRGRRWS